MRIYVAGSLADLDAVQEVQAAVISAGHEVTLDWTTGPDVTLSGYPSNAVGAGRSPGQIWRQFCKRMWGLWLRLNILAAACS